MTATTIEQNPYAAEANPYAAPMGSAQFSPTQVAQRNYGGIRRLRYFGLCMLAALVYNFAVFGAAVLMESGSGFEALGGGLVIFAFGCYMAAGIYIAVLRLRNMGSNPWWCLALIVPFLNLFVGTQMLICPEGYCDHKTLDTPAKIILGFFVGIIVLFILSLVAISVIGATATGV